MPGSEKNSRNEEQIIGIEFDPHIIVEGNHFRSPAENYFPNSGEREKAQILEL